MDNNEYLLGKKPLKENKINQEKLKELNQGNKENFTEEEIDDLINSFNENEGEEE